MSIKPLSRALVRASSSPPGEGIEHMQRGTSGTRQRLLFSACLTLVWAAAASPAEAETDEERQDEIKLWTCKDSELPEVEVRIAREIQMNPASSFGHYLYAYLMVRSFVNDPATTGQLKLAEVLAEQSIALDPQADWGYFIKSQILDLIGKGDMAATTIALGEAKGHRESWRLLFARARLGSSKNLGFAEAIKPYMAALKADGAVPEVILPFVIGIAKSYFEDPREVMRGLEQVEGYGGHHMLLATKAFLLTELKEYAEAERIYESLSRDRSDPEITLNRGILRYKYLGDPALAVKLLKAMPSAAPAYLRANRDFHLAAAYMQLKRGGEAESAMVSALRSTPERQRLVEAFAAQMSGAGRQKELRPLLEALNGRFPGMASLHALIGDLYAEHEGTPAKALPYFRNAILLEPDNSGFHVGQGLSFYKLKQYQEALNAFTRAFDVNPDDSSALYNQACMLSVLGKREEALIKLEQVIRMEPSYAETARNDPDFAALKREAKFQDVVSTGSPALPTDGAIGH